MVHQCLMFGSVNMLVENIWNLKDVKFYRILVNKLKGSKILFVICVNTYGDKFFLVSRVTVLLIHFSTSVVSILL